MALISKTFAGAGNRKTWTFSAWIKIIADTSKLYTLMTQVDGWAGNGNGGIYLNGESLQSYNLLSNVNDGTNSRVSTTAFLRDPSAWYHIVYRFDTTQSTASDRVRWYINGELQTDLVHSNYPGQNFDANFNTAAAHGIGRHTDANNYPFEGIMSHVHFCDGYSYGADSFGSTDSTTGEWKINTNPSVSYGTNGFFILKDGNSVTDQSGQGNNWSVTAGSVDKTEDNPSNNFCTGNPLARFAANVDYTNGNLTYNSGSGWFIGAGTMGASKGKWYYEYKIQTLGTGGGYHKLGFMSDIGIANSKAAGHLAEAIVDGGYAFYCQNGNLEVRTDDAVISGYSNSDLGVSFTNGDIMCVAVDMDNKKAYFRKNGDAWIKSADPVNGTNGLDISSDYPAGRIMIPAFASYYNGVGSLNFGNGYFGTTAVSSAGTNASGLGIFEFDVPTGYMALCTKGLNL